jgi:hypothetical protein
MALATRSKPCAPGAAEARVTASAEFVPGEKEQLRLTIECQLVGACCISGWLAAGMVVRPSAAFNPSARFTLSGTLV